MAQQKYQFINLNYMEQMSCGDQNTKKLLIEMIFKELKNEISAMRSFYEAENWKQLQGTSHKLKSTLAFIGNSKMTNSNEELWKRLNEKRYSTELFDFITILENHYPMVISELKTEYTHLN